MPEQIFKITMPPEATPLGAKQVRSALERMIQDFEYQVMELCAVPMEILEGKIRDAKTRDWPEWKEGAGRRIFAKLDTELKVRAKPFFKEDDIDYTP